VCAGLIYRMFLRINISYSPALNVTNSGKPQLIEKKKYAAVK